MFKLVFFVPESHLEAVKTAVFNAGAGRIGNYDLCCWQVPGQGQYRPLPGSRAYVGEPNKLCHLLEYRVEMVCADACVDASLAALKAAHPYETPAIDLWRLSDLAEV